MRPYDMHVAACFRIPILTSAEDEIDQSKEGKFPPFSVGARPSEDFFRPDWMGKTGHANQPAATRMDLE